MSRHSVTLIYVHIVFAIKYRKKILDRRLLDMIEDIFDHICHGYNSELIEFEGEEDHVHLLVRISPTTRISDFVRSLKTISSSEIRRLNLKSVTDNLWGRHIWSPSYFVASTGGAPLEVIKNYIRNQDSPRT